MTNDRSKALSPAEDAVDRARMNGTFALLVYEIQDAYWKAGQRCDSATAEQIAAEKIAGHIKLPPNLKPDHIGRCSRCGRAHILPLNDAEKAGRQDVVGRLCTLAQAVVKQDYTPQRDILVGDMSGAERTADILAGQSATTGGGRRVPNGGPVYDGRTTKSGHQGTGMRWPGKTGGGTATTKTTKRRGGWRIATGNRAENAIRREVEEDLKDKVARQRDETAMTDRKRAWMFANHGKASELQQKAQYFVHVLGLSERSAADRMGVSQPRIHQLLKDYAKNSA